MTDLTSQYILQAREDFFSYMAFVHRETDMPDVYEGSAVPAHHHQQMIEAITNGDHGHTLIVTPRGSGKTTLIQGYLEWSLGRASESGDKNWANRHRVLYVSAAASQAYKVSNAIRATIESNVHYQAIFPKVKKHKTKWGEEEWKVAGNTIKDSNFQAVGIDGAALGSRADMIILDDVGDEKNMATVYQRDLVKDRLDNTIMPILVPWGRVIDLCTRWAWDDVAQWAMERGFYTIYMKAIQEDGKGNEVSYWPARFTLDWLHSERRKNPKSFARQYQNEVTPEEGQIFERAWFEDRFSLLPNAADRLLTINSWDTASSQGRNRSFTAGWAIFVTKDFHCYFYQLMRAQVAYTYLKMGIKDLAKETRADMVIIEKKSSGHAVLDEFALDPEMRRKIVEWQPFGQKGSPSRLAANEAIAALGEQGRIHLPSDMYLRRIGADWMPAVERELFSYPDGESDDIVDAMCQALYKVRQLQINHEKLLASRIHQLPKQWQTPRSVEWAQPAL